jgi:hypothetical protein
MKTATFLTLLVSTQVLSAQTSYHNKAFGIAFQIPKGWMLGTGTPTVKDEFYTDAERDKILQNEKSIYLGDYFFGPASIGFGLIPKFQVNVVNKPEKTYLAYKKKFEDSAKKMSTFLTNFKVIKQPTETTVSGIKCMYIISEYTMVVQGINRSVRNRTYGVPYKNYLFHLSLIDGEDQDKTEDFDAFINSIKIGL